MDGNSVLRRIGLKNVGEVGRLRLRRNTKTVRPKSRETSFRIHLRLGDPDSVVFLDGSLDSLLKPLMVGIHIRAVELVVDLKGRVGEKRRLSPAQVVRSTTVEDLAVVSGHSRRSGLM